MFKSLRIAALSALVALGGLAALPAVVPSAAQADGLYFSYGQGHRHAHAPRRQYAPPRRARFCTPAHAVRKAARLGIDRAHVVRTNRNSVRVNGRRHHRPVTITFARAPHCPIIR